MAAITSGVDLPMAVGLDFVAGTLGDAAERWITDGEFNPRKSITSGLANAAGGRIYGNDPLKSAGSAFLRGFGSGAATSGINYISEFLGGMGQTGAGAYPGMPGMAGALVSGALSPYTNGRDPRSGCDSSGLPGQGLGYSAARGYQYSTRQAESLQGRKRNFDFGDFFQGMLTKGVTEGLSNAGSFGLGKVFSAVKRGIQGRKNRVPGGSQNVIDEMPSGNPQFYTEDLSHVTGKAAKTRQKAIEAILKEDFPDLRLTFKPEYSPFIRTGVAMRNTGTQIGKKMFVSRAELRDVIIHEELHHRLWKRGIINHHPRGTIQEKKFYELIRRYKEMRGWR